MNERRVLLFELDAAGQRLTESGAQGDRSRFRDDQLFRWAVAYLWLRFSEPATQMLSRKMIDKVAADQWAVLPIIRNSLAHDFDHQIDYDQLWALLPDLPMQVGSDVLRLMLVD